MHRLFKISLSFLLVLLWAQLSSAQVISYQRLATWSVQQIDSMASSIGVPSFLVNTAYPVDYYKVLYLTPYKHPDSLVQASMGLAVPQAPGCDIPLLAWGHGTQSRRQPSASGMNGGQWNLGVIFAGEGYITALPDYLGLGDADPRVLVHPYIHGFSQSHTTINALRASREIADTLTQDLNGQVFLFGYSQGGFTTAATVKEIQQNYAQEFQVAASAPMSGPYDLKNAQVDLIASDSVYSTPGYLPFILFSYQSMYENLYDSVSQVMKSPWATTIPPLFYAGNTGIGAINGMCTPVPKHMMQDSVVNAFLADSTHPLRLDLLDNHLVDGWYPTTPMRLFYCDQDEEVAFQNSINAYDAWTAAGAPDLGIQNMGSYSHFDCAQYAIMAGKLYFDGYKQDCNATTRETAIVRGISLYPNPSSGQFRIECPDLGQPLAVSVIDMAGHVILQTERPAGTSSVELDLPATAAGVYWVEVRSGDHRWGERLLFGK